MLFIKYTTLIVCLLLTCISEATSSMFRFWCDIDFFNTAVPARGVFVDMVEKAADGRLLTLDLFQVF